MIGGARHVEGNVSDLLSWQTAPTLIPAARSGCAVLVAAGPELRDPLEPQDPPTVRTDILYSADRRETVRTGKTRAPWKQKPSYQFPEASSSIHRLSRSGCSTIAFPSLAPLASIVGTALIGLPAQEGRDIQFVLINVAGSELFKITKPELFIRHLASDRSTLPEEAPSFARPCRVGLHLDHV